MEQTSSEKSSHAFKLSELCEMYKYRVKELGGNVSNNMQSTRLKIRLLNQMKNLKEFKDGKFRYLSFDDNIGEMLGCSLYRDFDHEAFILSKAANILQREILTKQYKAFDGSFTSDCQDEFAPQTLKSFIRIFLRVAKLMKNMPLNQASTSISQILIQNVVKKTRSEGTQAFLLNTL